MKKNNTYIDHIKGKILEKPSLTRNFKNILLTDYQRHEYK
jgi:hypothetical protein